MIRRFIVAVGAASLLAACLSVAHAQPLRTAVYPQGDVIASQAPIALAHVKQSGASFVRITVDWSLIAPATRPAAFDPANPADPAYRWYTADTQIENAARAGVVPYVTVLGAPAWAQTAPAATSNGPNRPDPRAFGVFMKTIATRFGGGFEGLPRVRYWEIWNEPNLTTYLQPQLVGGKPVSPAVYRSLLNAGAAAVKSVHPNNFVIAGAVSPFRDQDSIPQDTDWGPLDFTRSVLCLTASLKPACSAKARFDAWSFHPYTSGGPLHHANYPNDLSLGDLPKLRPILAAARRYGHISAPRFPELWATEFSWDTNGPDPKGVPMATLMQWLPEAMYRMWANGVSVVTWFGLRDVPRSQSYVQSGLYFSHGPSFTGDRPKPILAAFRFPLYATPRGGGVYVWGRVPPGSQGQVVVEQKVGGRWARLAVVRSDASGIFSRVLGAHGTGDVRARALRTGARSPAHQLRELPDRFYPVFGS